MGDEDKEEGDDAEEVEDGLDMMDELKKKQSTT